MDPAQILFTCLGYQATAVKTAQLAGLPAEEWRRVVDLAYAHKVAPLLHQALRAMNLPIPGELTSELERSYRQNTFRNLRLYQELNKLLGWMQTGNIPVIVLKGAYLAIAVYENLGLRTMGDVDILVPESEVLRVEQELLKQGFEAEIEERLITPITYHFRYALGGDQFVIEVHWKVIGDNFPFQVDTQGLWNRAQPFNLAQVPVLAFSPEDSLLHLCLHSVKHAYKYRIEHDTRLRSLCDIGEVVRRFGAQMDWQIVAERAQQWGAVHAVYLMLRLGRDLLELPVPADFLEKIKPAGFNERYMEIARKESRAGRYTGDVVTYDQKPAAKLWGTGNPLQKLGFFIERWFQSRESMAEMYPVPANSWRIYLYYPVRLKDMLVRHSPMMWRLLRSDRQMTTQVQRTNQLDELHNWLISG